MFPDARIPRAAVLFPFRAWLAHPLLRAWTTWVFVALVTAPALGLAFFRDARGVVGETVVFATYFAVAWFLVLWVVVRPQRVDGRVLAEIIALAVVIVGPLALALEEILDGDLAHLVPSILGVGLPEELAKLVPVAIVAMTHRRLGLAPRDMLFLGAVSGLVFGAVEAVRYGTVYASPLTTQHGSLVTVWRLLTDPISHACWAGIAGYFLGLAMYYRAPRHVAALVAIGLGVPVGAPWHQRLGPGQRRDGVGARHRRQHAAVPRLRPRRARDGSDSRYGPATARCAGDARRPGDRADARASDGRRSVRWSAPPAAGGRSNRTGRLLAVGSRRSGGASEPAPRDAGRMFGVVDVVVTF